MTRYAVIRDGVVEGVYIGDDQWGANNPTAVALGASSRVGPGYTYSGGSFHPPDAAPEPIPRSISRRQARQALFVNGFTFDQIRNAAKANLTDPQLTLTLIFLDDAAEFARDNPTLLALAALINLTSNQLDNLFVQASKL